MTSPRVRAPVFQRCTASLNPVRRPGLIGNQREQDNIRLRRNTYIIQHTTHRASRGPILRIGAPAIHRLVSMSRYAAKTTYKQIVCGERTNVDVRDPFTGLPVRTDTQDRALVDGAINQQPSHLHAEVSDVDNNVMDRGAPLPLPVEILPDVDVDDWLLEVCREDSVDSAPVHILQMTNDGVVVVLMPAYQAYGCKVGCQAVLLEGTAQHEARLNPFSRIELRPITFKDEVVMCCSCSNPGCDRSEVDNDLVESEMQMPDQAHRSRAAALGHCNTLCRCALAALLASKFASLGSWNTFSHGSFCTWYQEQDSFSTSHHTAYAWNHASFDRTVTQCGSQTQQVLGTATGE
jgi:hypothetical protein